MTELDGPRYADTAFKSTSIGLLPGSSRRRKRVGDELQPMGVYAGANPYNGVVEDVKTLQDHEVGDPEFTDKDWWWDHSRIRFLNGKVGLKFLILLIPLTWVLLLVVGGMALIGWGLLELAGQYEWPAFW